MGLVAGFFRRGILVTIGRRRKEAVNETEQKWACPPLHPSATFWAGVAKREGRENTSFGLFVRRSRDRLNGRLYWHWYFFCGGKRWESWNVVEKYNGGFYSCYIYDNPLTFLMQYFTQGSVCTVHIDFGQFSNYLSGNCHQISSPSFTFLPLFFCNCKAWLLRSQTCHAFIRLATCDAAKRKEKKGSSRV